MSGKARQAMMLEGMKTASGCDSFMRWLGGK
jgi:hypothetical protein